MGLLGNEPETLVRQLQNMQMKATHLTNFNGYLTVLIIKFQLQLIWKSGKCVLKEIS